MNVYNSTVSAVPKEALVPKKEFLTSENTLKLVRFHSMGNLSTFFVIAAYIPVLFFENIISK